MSNHQKRLSVPKSWPVERKTETFTVKADAGPHGEAGVPLLIVLRDVLGYVDNRKEARYALNQDNVRINGKAVSDEERPVGMFDILAFMERDEYYRVFPGEGGRLALTEIDEDSAGSKLGKIVNKQHVAGGDVQLTLHDGETLLVEADSPYNGGDSIVVSNEGEEILAHFTYEEGALVTAVDGTHAGDVGTIDEIQITPGSSSNNVVVTRESGGDFETVEEYVVVIDENFIDDESAEASTDAESADADEDEAAEASTDADSADADGDATDESAGDEDSGTESESRRTSSDGGDDE